jgi:hypothetical protein
LVTVVCNTPVKLIKYLLSTSESLEEFCSVEEWPYFTSKGKLNVVA